MFRPHAHHTATLLRNGKVLVVGGETVYNGATVVTATSELYDPTTGTWVVTGSLKGPRSSHAATLLGNGQVLVTGGTAGSLSFVTSAEVYDSAGVWETAGAMSMARMFFTLTTLADGQAV